MEGALPVPDLCVCACERACVCVCAHSLSRLQLPPLCVCQQGVHVGGSLACLDLKGKTSPSLCHY